MREIKFRAWNKKERKYWIDGKYLPFGEGGATLYLSAEGHLIVFTSSDGGKDGLWEHDTGEGGDLILQQFTGLKDKNGKEIYEGDIVSYESLGSKSGEVWLNEVVGWKFNTKYGYSLSDHRKMKVIGNIYQNPDLIPN